MSTMQSASNSPQSLKRERDEDNDLETQLYVPDCDKIIKGEHDEGDDLETPIYVPDCEASNSFSTTLSNRTPNLKRESDPSSTSPSKRASSPARSSTGSLSDVGTATPSAPRTSPATAFTALNGTVEPPKKRAKLTFAEKEEQKILKAIKYQEKAEERARKEIEKKAKEEDKARRDVDREAERKKKEAEKEEKRLVKEAERAEKEEKRLIREAERAEKEKEKKAKEDERRRKEEEKQRIEEEKKKKERSQPKLNAFFKKTDTSVKDEGPRKSPSPAPGATLQPISTSVTKSPCKNDSLSEYQKRFPPFFVQNNVRVAAFTQFGRDEGASNLLQNVIDSYIHGQRSPEKQRPFDSARLFNLPNYDVKPRGRRIIPVREIMSQILGHAKRPIDLTTDTQNMQIKTTRTLLQTVPYKILSFAEDVRPPYKGTYTSQPKSGMRRLARNPLRQDLPDVNYDYDSEAEWEAEDGEDIESDCDEDEDIGDGGEDLEGFLDDAGAETLNARKFVMQADLEPKCSGLCWENQKRRGPNVKMYRYLMEVITENNQIKTPIDPFATHYWDAPTPARLMEPPRLPLNTIKSTNAGFNGASSTPTSFFGNSNQNKPATQSCSTLKQPKKLISMEDMPAFKQAVNGSELSKLGLIEVLNKQFSKISKSTIKYTLETIAKRVGSKEAEKRWVLIEEGAG